MHEQHKPENRVLVNMNGVLQLWDYRDGIQEFASTLGARVIRVYPTGQAASEALDALTKAEVKTSTNI